jgi:pimeloyl-ACP methyl ester carboxylesterase
VVSFDPQGIERSSPIRCSPDLVPPATAPRDHPPTAAEFEAIAHANAVFIASCLEATGELMRYLSAMDTAADVEQIRQALSPNDGLVAYGASHGSQYGQAYLEHYGEHIKALVLDGVVDHSIDLPTFITRNTLAVQDAFERFGQWCNRDGACALAWPERGIRLRRGGDRSPGDPDAGATVPRGGPRSGVRLADDREDARGGAGWQHLQGGRAGGHERGLHEHGLR